MQQQLNLPSEVQRAKCSEERSFLPSTGLSRLSSILIASLIYSHNSVWINNTINVNDVFLFQYEYALRQLYALVNVCEGGYPIDR